MTAVDPTALAAAATAMLDAVVSGIEEQRDHLTAAFSATVATSAPRVCLGRSRSSGEACDRQPGHRGLCSFEFDELAARYRSFEETAARVPALETELHGLRSSVAAAQSELRESRAKRAATAPAAP